MTTEIKECPKCKRQTLRDGTCDICGFTAKTTTTTETKKESPKKTK